MTNPNTDPVEPTESQEIDSEELESQTTANQEISSDPAESAVGDTAPVRAEHAKVKGSLASGTWAALIVGALLLILLLVFILQNQKSVALKFFAWEWNFPIGVGMLLAAIAGALIVGLVGIVRMAQLRRQIKRSYR